MQPLLCSKSIKYNLISNSHPAFCIAFLFAEQLVTPPATEWSSYGWFFPTDSYTVVLVAAPLPGFASADLSSPSYVASQPGADFRMPLVVQSFQATYYYSIQVDWIDSYLVGYSDGEQKNNQFLKCYWKFRLILNNLVTRKPLSSFMIKETFRYIALVLNIFCLISLLQ